MSVYVDDMRAGFGKPMGDPETARERMREHCRGVIKKIKKEATA